MKFIGESYSLCAKSIHQICCRSAKFLWKSKFCSGSGSGSGSWYYFGFQYQTYIWYIEDTHQILFGSAYSFEIYCVPMKSPRTYSQTTRETDGNFFLLVLSSKPYKTWTFVKRREFFFTHSITILSLFTYSVWDEKVKYCWLQNLFLTHISSLDIVSEWTPSKKIFYLYRHSNYLSHYLQAITRPPITW